MSFYICSNCGAGSASWMGRCSDCGEFNTLQKREEEQTSSRKKSKVEKLTAVSLSNIPSLKNTRTSTGMYEFDRVLGGGVVPGSVILLTGEPGVGKSTLLLQSLRALKTLYISGEEAPEQVKDRAERLGVSLATSFFSSNAQVESIVRSIPDWISKVDIVVVDSIQTVYSADVEAPPGAVSQLRECANQLITAAKMHKIPILIVGHVTKDGDIAGPKTLEHMVDTVLSFEGERVSQFRVLRAKKNRFGATDEIGVFEMSGKGLQEVSNPLAFVESDGEHVPGKAVVGVTEGQRTLFFEIQALATPSALAMPRRVVKGLDYNKVLLLLAVLRKHLSVPLEKYDVYLNVIGGVDIKSTAADLGVIAAILSSVKNVSIDSYLFTGEVGLLGEVRKTHADGKIINEAKRLKFKAVYSAANMSTIRELKRLITPK